MIRRRVVVRGEVQGVFFRDGLREGRPGDVDALVAWCRGGSPPARVDDVQVEEREPTGEDGFEVR